MTTTIKAIYERGVFRPTASVELTEGTCVEVLIPQVVFNREPNAVAANLARIAAKAPQRDHPESTCRDHDQILYGGKA